MIEDPCLVCGKESDYGAHGMKDGVIYSEYFCERHYHAKKRGVEVPDETPVQESLPSAVQSDLPQELVSDDGSGRRDAAQVDAIQTEAPAPHLPVQGV